MRRSTRRTNAGLSLLLLAGACTPSLRNRDAGGAQDAPLEGDAGASDAAALDGTGPEDAASLDAPAAPDAPSVPDVASAEVSTSPDAAPPEAAVEPCPTAGLRRCDGRCVDLASDMSHCGACSAACIAGANQTAECIAGECDRPCSRGFANCDGLIANGCETSLTTAMHCGACGRACASGEVCVAGACSSAMSAAAPRPYAPQSGVRVANRRPTFVWLLPSGASGAEVQVCRDRGCRDVAQTQGFDGPRGRLTAPLEPGTYWWRVRSRVAGAAVGSYGAPWMFRVLARETSAALAWSALPDFNGDGLADVVVSAMDAAGGLGEVRVWNGARTGLAAAPSTVLTGTGRAGAGDEFGYDLDAGDLNGDGVVELLVGSSGLGMGAGSLFVYEGAPNGVRTRFWWQIAGSVLVSGVGSRVAGGVDLDGDGYGDVLVSASVAGGSRLQGAVLIYRGAAAGSPTPGGPFVTLDFATDRPDRRFGIDAALLGDVNGDGYIDVAGAASARPDEPGQVGVFHGAPGTIVGTPARVYMAPGGGQTNDRFGRSLAPAGDVNGDGFDDLLVGAPGLDGERGAAWLFLGSATGLAMTPSFTLRGTEPGELLGVEVAGTGDVNGDGFDDVVIAAGGASATTRVYLGGAMGLRAEPITLMDMAGSTRLATVRAAIVGDVNGDGFDDVVTTANCGERGQPGVAYLFLGSRAGVTARPAWRSLGTGGDRLGVGIAR